MGEQVCVYISLAASKEGNATFQSSHKCYLINNLIHNQPRDVVAIEPDWLR